MLYRLDFTVEYDETMAQQGLLGVWAEEANAALGAKSAGVVVDLWKVVGGRKVLVIADVETPDNLDRILFDLPITSNGWDGNKRSVGRDVLAHA